MYVLAPKHLRTPYRKPAVSGALGSGVASRAFPEPIPGRARIQTHMDTGATNAGQCGHRGLTHPQAGREKRTVFLPGRKEEPPCHGILVGVHRGEDSRLKILYVLIKF